MRSNSSTIIHRRAPAGRLPNVHPGEILLEEFLKPMGISAYKLAKETKLSQTRISEILRMKRGVTAETALRLSKYFGNSAEFWLGLQNDYDLEENRIALHKELESIRSVVTSIEPPLAVIKGGSRRRESPGRKLARAAAAIRSR